MANARERVGELVRRIEALADPSMRVGYLRHAAAEMDPALLADVVTVAVHAAEARDASYAELLLALCVALAHDDRAEQRERAAAAAAVQGQHETAALLSRRPAVRSVDEPLSEPDFGRGRALTLGERKSIARGRDRDVLARVLRDPHPDVIRILLANPTLTEEDVLRLCAQRPVAEEVLREVFRSTRWIVRYRVRSAIVQNPFAPVDVALQLAVHLNAADAREVARAEDLSPEVRETCRRVAGLATLH